MAPVPAHVGAGVSVVLPTGRPEPHRDRALSMVRSWWASRFPGWQVIVSPSETVPYVKAEAVNAARRDVTGKIVVIADGDVFCDPARVVEITRRAENGEWGWPWDAMARLTRDASDALDELPDDLPADTPVEQVTHPHPGGLVVVPKWLFDDVHGMDPRFVGWGREDNAFAEACTRLGSPPVRLPGRLWHLWHPRDPQRTKTPEFEANRRLFFRYRKAVTRRQMRALIEERTDAVLGPRR